MRPLLVAVIVILVIVIGVYVATRGLPPPWTPTSTCKVDSDCPFPKTCDVATSACVDEVLPGLLTAAQNAAQQLYTAIQAVVANLQNVYAAHANTLVASAVAMGLSAPSLTALAADLAAGVQNVNKYVQQALAVAGCNPATSTACGYWAEIMSLTPSSNTASIWNTGSQGKMVLDELPTATGAFPPVASDLGNVVSYISADSTAKRLPLDGPTQAALNAVNADIAQLNGYASSLTALATAVSQTGFALYNHYMPG